MKHVAEELIATAKEMERREWAKNAFFLEPDGVTKPSIIMMQGSGDKHPDVSCCLEGACYIANSRCFTELAAKAFKRVSGSHPAIFNDQIADTKQDCIDMLYQVADDETLNEVLYGLGYTTYAYADYKKDIYKGMITKFTGTAGEVWQWLRDTKQISLETFSNADLLGVSDETK